jgi:hypothetical protein
MWNAWNVELKCSFCLVISQDSNSMYFSPIVNFKLQLCYGIIYHNMYKSGHKKCFVSRFSCMINILILQKNIASIDCFDYSTQNSFWLLALKK